jgi:hypothetical protein
MKHTDARVTEERTAADIAAYKTLTTESLDRWEQCRSAHRFMAFTGKTLVAYRLADLPEDAPEVLETFENLSASLHPSEGLSSIWKTSNGSHLLLGSSPQEIATGCFMWHPKYNTLELVDWKGGKSLKFSVMWRTALNPSYKKKGTVYLS